MVICPNPCTHSAIISYTVLEPAEIQCAVFDVTGREVRTICSSHRLPGLHSFVWDRKDNNNRLVESGVYFIRLATETQETQSKLIVLQ